MTLFWQGKQLLSSTVTFPSELPPLSLGFLVLCPSTIYTSCKFGPIILIVCLVLPLQALISGDNEQGVNGRGAEQAALGGAAPCQP